MFGFGFGVSQRGTSRVSFLAEHERVSSHITGSYQTITMMPYYSDKSLEELRWEDYQTGNDRLGKQPLNSGRTTSSSPFMAALSRAASGLTQQQPVSMGCTGFSFSDFGSPSSSNHSAMTSNPSPPTFSFGGRGGTNASKPLNLPFDTVPSHITQPSFGSTGCTLLQNPPQFNFGRSNLTPGALSSHTFPNFGNSNSTPGNVTSHTAPTFGGHTSPTFGGHTAPTFGGHTAPTFGGHTAPTFGSSNSTAVNMANPAATSSFFGSAGNVTSHSTPSLFGFPGPAPPSLFGRPEINLFCGSSNKQTPSLFGLSPGSGTKRGLSAEISGITPSSCPLDFSVNGGNSSAKRSLEADTVINQFSNAPQNAKVHSAQQQQPVAFGGGTTVNESLQSQPQPTAMTSASVVALLEANQVKMLAEIELLRAHVKDLTDQQEQERERGRDATEMQRLRDRITELEARWTDFAVLLAGRALVGGGDERSAAQGEGTPPQSDHEQVDEKGD